MALSWLRRDREAQQAPPVPPEPTGGAPVGDGRPGGGSVEGADVARLRAALRQTVARANQAAGRLPVGVVPEVRAIEDVLVELLDHAASPGTFVSAQSQFSLAATIEDYLPTSVNAFLALPPAFAGSHRSAAGRTPGEELLEQLILLEGAVRDLALVVYGDEAEQLSTQGRFLDTKFSRSDLDLD